MNPADTRPWRRRSARIVGCASTLAAVACASGHAGNPPPSAMFTVVNNTASAVTIAECRGQINDCVNGPPAHLPPRGQLSSPLSSSPATPHLLEITGYGSQTSCILVPTKPGRVKVTQATTSACTAPSAP